ncbi:lectin 6-like [Hevea brasiliensis]|uniref:lectin 6-like n=1 Tax=Hevea brasiliensis TaxID=3981 RepID=UPI0025D76D06|nr:lectin 6-like [Hevea brasiliensis]
MAKFMGFGLNTVAELLPCFPKKQSDAPVTLLWKSPDGDASPLDSVIQHTPNQLSQTGHATYVEPLHLWDNASGSHADFTTNFSFSIDAQNNASHADGLAFFIVPPQYRMPDERQGSVIGLASGKLILNSTANPFVAVEFDTYYNPWDDMDHVGIDISSLKSLKSVKRYSSVMDGRVINARINYNSSSKNLYVYFTGVSGIGLASGNMTIISTANPFVTVTQPILERKKWITSLRRPRRR